METFFIHLNRDVNIETNKYLKYELPRKFVINFKNNLFKMTYHLILEYLQLF